MLTAAQAFGQAEYKHLPEGGTVTTRVRPQHAAVHGDHQALTP